MASTIGIEDLSSSAAWRAADGPDVGNILQLAREAIDSFWRFLLAIPFLLIPESHPAMRRRQGMVWVRAALWTKRGIIVWS